MTLTGVGHFICCAHRGHGHTWEITAWFPEGRDALELQAELRSRLSTIDHSELLDDLATGEGIARAVAEMMPECVSVDIGRPAERIFARYIKETDNATE